MSPLSPSAKQAIEDQSFKDAVAYGQGSVLMGVDPAKPGSDVTAYTAAGGCYTMAQKGLTVEDVKRIADKMKDSQRLFGSHLPMWASPQPPTYQRRTPYDSPWGIDQSISSILEFAGALRASLMLAEVVPGVEGATLMSVFHLEDTPPTRLRYIEVRDIFGCGVMIRWHGEGRLEVQWHVERIVRKWREMMVTPPRGLEGLLPHQDGAVGFRIGYRTWRAGEVRAFYDPPPLEITEEMPDDIHEMQIKVKRGHVLMSGFGGVEWGPRKPCIIPGKGVGFFARKQAEVDAQLWAGVEGLVALWGDVYEHSDGYRASHAYPYAIIDDAGTAELYGVPCITREEAEVML